MNKSTKLLATVAAFVMVLAAVSVFASDDALATEHECSDSGNVAKIGDTEYDTLVKAVAAAEEKNDPATTINVLRCSEGAGIFIHDGVGFTIDFGGHTYKCTGPAVGSKGTESQAVHIDPNAGTIILKNGTITSVADKGVKMLVQVHKSDFTVENMVLDGRNLDESNVGYYTLSTYKDGPSVTIRDTIIYAHDGGFAFDSFKNANVTVEGDNTYIHGTIECVPDAKIAIKAGTFSDMTAINYAAKDANIKIVLDADQEGPGIGIFGAKNVNATIDLNGHTYKCVGSPVGSSTTQSQVFHFEKGNTVSISNGKITSVKDPKILMLIQNYCDLTLNKVTVDATGTSVVYPVSNNCGNVIIADSKIISKDGKFALDSCKFSSYPLPNVTITNSDIYGNIECSANLVINSGTYNGMFVCSGDKANLVINGGTFSDMTAINYAVQDAIINIELQADQTGPGIGIFGAKNVNATINLNGHTYTCKGPMAVGSKGTETQAFHLEKGNTVTIKNGKIDADNSADGSKVMVMINNYCDLTLTDVTVDGSNLIDGNYGMLNFKKGYQTVVCNNGTVTIDGNTTITKVNDDSLPAYGLVVNWWNSYSDGSQVTLNTEGEIQNILMSVDNASTVAKDSKSKLTITNAVIAGKITVEPGLPATCLGTSVPLQKGTTLTFVGGTTLTKDLTITGPDNSIFRGAFTANDTVSFTGGSIEISGIKATSEVSIAANGNVTIDGISTPEDVTITNVDDGKSDIVINGIEITGDSDVKLSVEGNANVILTGNVSSTSDKTLSVDGKITVDPEASVNVPLDVDTLYVEDGTTISDRINVYNMIILGGKNAFCSPNVTLSGEYAIIELDDKFTYTYDGKPVYQIIACCMYGGSDRAFNSILPSLSVDVNEKNFDRWSVSQFTKVENKTYVISPVLKGLMPQGQYGVTIDVDGNAISYHFEKTKDGYYYPYDSGKLYAEITYLDAGMDVHFKTISIFGNEFGLYDGSFTFSEEIAYVMMSVYHRSEGIDTEVSSGDGVASYTISYVLYEDRVDVVSYKFGEKIEDYVPEREGYTFLGWNETVPEYMPAADLIVNADWKISSYTLTVNYVSDDGKISETTSGIYQYGAEYNVPNPSKEGYSTDSNAVTGIMPASNVTVTVEYTLNSYTITFDTKGGSAVGSITAKYGEAITAPAAPTKTGYTFVKWDPEVPATMPAENMTIEAVWEVNSYTLTVNYVSDDGKITKTVSGKYAYGSEYRVETPTEVGYSPDKAVVSGTMPADNLTVTVTYILNEYTVTFDSDNGSAVTTVSVKHGNTVAKPTVDPTRTEAEFKGWYLGDSLYNFDAPVTGNITLVAKWKVNEYTVTFDSDDVSVKNGDNVLRSGDKVPYGTMLTVKAEEHVGYTASVVKAGSTIISSETYELKGNVEFTVEYTINSYTITFDPDNGEAVTKVTEDYGKAIAAPAAPTKTGYTFVKWDPEVPATMPAENMTIKAVWKVNQYTIAFDPDNGEAVTKVTEDYGKAIAAPAAPTKTGYTFVKWDPAVPATMPAENMTLKAVWKINEYEITFGAELTVKNGSAVLISGAKVDYGSVLTVTAEGKYGYNAIIKANGTAIVGNEFTVGVTNVRFTVEYVAIEYDIKYVINGTNYFGKWTYGTELVVPESVVSAATSIEGYTFKGWSPELSAVSPDNLVFVAQYDIQTFTIERNSVGTSGGAVIDTVNYGDTKEYTFLLSAGQTITVNSITEGVDWELNGNVLTIKNIKCNVQLEYTIA